MIEFPAIWLLYIAIVLGGLLLLLALFYISNAIRYGAHMVLTAISSTIYLAGLIGIVWITWISLATVDWSQTFSISLPSASTFHLGL